MHPTTNTARVAGLLYVFKAAPRTSATIPITSSRVRSIFDSSSLGKACSCSPALSIPLKSGTLRSAARHQGRSCMGQG